MKNVRIKVQVSVEVKVAFGVTQLVSRLESIENQITSNYSFIIRSAKWRLKNGFDLILNIEVVNWFFRQRFLSTCVQPVVSYSVIFLMCTPEDIL